MSVAMKFTVDSGGCESTQPLIYLWQIFDAQEKACFSYVGKAQGGASRPLIHYLRNVGNLLARRPYRKSKPDGYREVHRRLAEAVLLSRSIKLTFLCNVGAMEDINDVEKKWQRHYDCMDARYRK